MTTDSQLNADGADEIKRPIKSEDLVWIQCRGHRCLAYPDGKGGWISFYTGKKVTDFIKVIR